MNWFAKLHGKLVPVPSPTEVTQESKDNTAEAEQILNSAKAALGEARTRYEEVRVVTSSLASQRARNHFGESIQIAMTQGRRP